jgi:hypothetical protein
MRIVFGNTPARRVISQIHTPNPHSFHLTCKTTLARSLHSHRLLQTMCQGHEDAGAAPGAKKPAVNVNKAQKTWTKPPNNPPRKGNNSPAPEKKPALPTHELVKLAAAKLANGHKYVDVRPHPSPPSFPQ